MNWKETEILLTALPEPSVTLTLSGELGDCPTLPVCPLPDVMLRWSECAEASARIYLTRGASSETLDCLTSFRDIVIRIPEGSRFETLIEAPNNRTTQECDMPPARLVPGPRRV